MATSQTSPGKKTSAKTGPGLPAKKTLAKKVAATPTKSVTPKIATQQPAARKSGASTKGVAKSSIAPEARYRMIEAAAYLRAERRGFASGNALDDWVAAEAEIDALLNS